MLQLSRFSSSLGALALSSIAALVVAKLAAAAPLAAVPEPFRQLPTAIHRIAFSAEVQRIQQALNELGYDAGPADGLLGSRTRNAIRAFQRDLGLPVTGEPSMSLARQIEVQAGRRAVASGAVPGTDGQQAAEGASGLIVDIQSGLRRLGYAVPVVSGRLDDETEHAIRAYQRDHRLLVDGRASAELAGHIGATASEAGIVEDRATTQAVQRELNTRGYDAGPAEGIMSEKTRDAIRTFQSDAGLPLNGRITPDLLVELGLAAPPPAAEGRGLPEVEPRPVRVLADTFDDGDYTSNPSWEVVAGEWSVTDGGALTSGVSATSRPATPELGPDLLKELLGGALGLSRQQEQQQRNLAVIHVRAPLGRAFRLRLRIEGSGNPATFNFGPYQGNNVGYGYRLESRSETARPLRLLAVTAEGGSVVGTGERGVRLDDGAKHWLEWRREANGRLTIELDGEVILQVRDQTFDGPFDGLSLINAGGHWDIDEVEAETLEPS